MTDRPTPSLRNRAARRLYRFARLRQRWTWSWVALGVAILVLGVVGFRLQGYTQWDTLIYKTFQLFTLESISELADPLEPGDSSAPPPGVLIRVLRILAVLFAVGALLVFFRERLQRLSLRVLSKGHAVVSCGSGGQGALLARSLHEHGYPVVAIAPKGGDCAELSDLDIPVVEGDPTEAETLRDAALHKAAYLFVAEEHTPESLRIAHAARRFSEKRKRGALDCLVCTTSSAPRALTVSDDVFVERPFYRHAFQLLDRAAHALAEELIDGKGESAPPPHLLIVGDGEFCERLIVNCAYLWPADRPGPPLRITVDPEAMYERCRDHPAVRKIAVSALTVPLSELEPPTKIVVSASDSLACYERAHELAALLPDSIVTAAVADEAVFAEWEATKNGAYVPGNLEVYHSLGRLLDPQVLLRCTFDLYARQVHEAYLKIQDQADLRPKDDPARWAWAKLPEHLKDSNRAFAADIERKLQALGCRRVPLRDEDSAFEFNDDELDRLARMEHERWLRERSKATGRRDADETWKLAEERDVNRRESPLLVAWEDLDPVVRDWDRELVRAIPAILRSAGWGLERA